MVAVPVATAVELTSTENEPSPATLAWVDPSDWPSPFRSYSIGRAAVEPADRVTSPEMRSFPKLGEAIAYSAGASSVA